MVKVGVYLVLRLLLVFIDIWLGGIVVVVGVFIFVLAVFLVIF